MGSGQDRRLILPATASAEDKLTAVSELMGIINNSITTDTQEAQRLLTEGAQSAQQAIEKANAAQREGAEAQIEAAKKMVDFGRQLADYVQGLAADAIVASIVEAAGMIRKQ